MAPGTKQATAVRRFSSSLSKVSTPPTTPTSTIITRPSKPSKQSKIIHFNLSKDVLSRFPHDQAPRKSSHLKKSPLSTSTTVASGEPVAVKSDPESTTVIKGEAAPSPAKAIKAEDGQGPMTGEKRELGTGVDGDEKAKANPRKRPRP